MTAKAKTFADLRSPRSGRTKGCPRCGAGRNAGAVQIQLQDLTSKGTLGGRVCSRAKSMCEPCAIEVYDLALALLLAESKAEA